MKFYIFVVFVCISCSSSDGYVNIDTTKCIDDCCYNENLSCKDFVANGVATNPYPVKCNTPHYGGFEIEIKNKVCYKMTDDSLNFCCEKP